MRRWQSAGLGALLIGAASIGGWFAGRIEERPAPPAIAEKTADEIADPRLVPQYNGAGCASGPFDSKGAILVDYGTTFGPDLGRQYNPTTISQTALGCYASFKRSGNETYKRRFLDQIEWLKTNTVKHGEDAAAYEYQFTWSHDLKPGWRSALAQGQAISALVRYFYETGDASILPLIKQIKNYMLIPIEQGGVTATSPEGHIWFEEYPTKPTSYVLNGFISATFGLYEFTKLFPEDRKARAEFKAAIESLKAALPHYDSGDWTYLDRRALPYPKANDAYGIGYVWQTRSLWSITKDPVFLSTSLRWASFFDDVNLKKMGNMDQSDGVYRLNPEIPSYFPKNVLRRAKVVKAPEVIPGYEVEKLWDSDFDTYLAPASGGPAVLEFELEKSARVNTLAISLYNVELYPTDLKIEVRRARQTEFEEVPYRRTSSRRNFVYHFTKPVDAAAIRLSASAYAGQDRLVIGDLALGFYTAKPVYAGYGSRTFPPQELPAGEFKVRIDAPAESRGRIIGIYRRAASEEAIEKAPWEWRHFDPVEGGTVRSEGEFMQFRIISTADAAKRGWYRFSVEQADPIRSSTETSAFPPG